MEVIGFDETSEIVEKDIDVDQRRDSVFEHLLGFLIDRSNELSGEHRVRSDGDRYGCTYGDIVRTQTCHGKMVHSIDELLDDFFFQSSDDPLNEIALQRVEFRIRD